MKTEALAELTHYMNYLIKLQHSTYKKTTKSRNLNKKFQIHDTTLTTLCLIAISGKQKIIIALLIL